MTQQTEAQLHVEKIESNAGYTILKETEIFLPNSYNYSLHIINLTQLENIILNLRSTAREMTLELIKYSIKSTLFKDIDNLLYKLMTLKDGHHSIHKRGLVNFIGTINKWITGTMDDEDRQLINKHLHTIEQNNENLALNINEQIKINDNFNKTMNKLYNAMLEDRKIIQNFIIDRENQTLLRLIIFDIKLKIQEIDKIISELQDNIMFSNLNIIHPSLLTHEEIVEYKIDADKIKNLKVGYSKTGNNKLIFLIKIPYSMEKLNKKIIIPLSNIDDCSSIDYEITKTFETNNTYYEYNINKAFHELSNLKHCILSKNCQNIKNCNTEIYSINDNSILIQLANNVILTSNYDERTFKLNGNYFIKFFNCSISINNKTFQNKIKEVNNDFIIQNLDYKSINNTFTFKEIILETSKNMNEIKLLKFHKILTYSGVSIISIIFITLIIILILYIKFKQNKINIKFANRVQENSTLNEGRVTFHETNKVEDKNAHSTILF